MLTSFFLKMKLGQKLWLTKSCFIFKIVFIYESKIVIQDIIDF